MTPSSVLLDTHTVLWWWGNVELLSKNAIEIVAQADRVFVSAASAWEVATKVRIGKLDAQPAVDNWGDWLRESRFQSLDVSATHALAAGSLPGRHRDPFDRMLVAQGNIEGMPIVSRDKCLEELGGHRIW